MEHDASGPDIRRVASSIVVVVGMYQGAVPLVVRAAFGGDQRFAPALWLPSPWWWIACVAIVAATLALAVLEVSGPGDASGVAADPPAGDPPTDPDRGMGRAVSTVGYDALSNLVFLLGVYNGLAPFVARLVFDGDLLLAFTLHLPSPWWWIASLAVVAVALVLLTLIDEAKKRHLAGQR
jgi:hypothetical protein